MQYMWLKILHVEESKGKTELLNKIISSVVNLQLTDEKWQFPVLLLFQPMMQLTTTTTTITTTTTTTAIRTHQ